jgi:hypothetical protein
MSEEETMLPLKQSIVGDDEEGNEESYNRKPSTTSYVFLALLAVISIVTYPRNGLVSSEEVTVNRVWYFGWITAITTGLGAIPLIFLTKPKAYIFGGASAVAAGMMMSASFGLLSEGIIESRTNSSKLMKMFSGISVGWVFLQLAKHYLEKYNLSIGFKDVNKKSLKKLVLVIFVMTLHSFSEGVAIGVSFAGEHSLGLFISCSLAGI